MPVAAAHASKMWGVYFRYGSPDQRDPGLMHRAHIKTVRFPIYWYQVQPQEKGPYNWGPYDQRIGAFASRGIVTLPTLQGPPGYAAGDIDTPPVGSGKSRREWKAFVRAAVRRYGRHGKYWRHAYHSQFGHHHPRPIKYWEVWNEPNLPRFNHAKHPVKAFAKLVKISHRPIHRRHGKLVLGGIPDGPKFHFWAFLNRLYRVHGIKRKFEVVDAHPYSASIHELRGRMNRYRHVMNKHHDRRTPIFIGEFGWGSGRPDGDVNRGLHGQARMLKRSFRLFVHHRKKWHLKRVIWYEWRDPASSTPGEQCPFCDVSGLLRSDFSKKPAYRAYKHFAGHH
ncbi:MAG TPA: hypothetical protein VKG89_01770 [Solirubrobacterales bacterium]|nr:hypothetical protein [Solirubrobacterales bacterium]